MSSAISKKLVLNFCNQESATLLSASGMDALADLFDSVFREGQQSITFIGEGIDGVVIEGAEARQALIEDCPYRAEDPRNLFWWKGWHEYENKGLG